jgi:hypothetical protein
MNLQAAGRDPDAAARQISVLFARNPDPSEGVLTPLGEDALRKAFEQEDLVYVKRSGEEETASVVTGQDNEYWTWALAAMLALMAVETVLAQRFGHYS